MVHYLILLVYFAPSPVKCDVLELNYQYRINVNIEEIVAVRLLVLDEQFENVKAGFEYSHYYLNTWCNVPTHEYDPYDPVQWVEQTSNGYVVVIDNQKFIAPTMRKTITAYNRVEFFKELKLK